MTWYAANGEPRWDNDELWTTMGHLYKGGMWFKKKSVLQTEGNYNSNTAVDGIDWRTNSRTDGWTLSNTLPSAADAGKYFYLPALGIYEFGRLVFVGKRGIYWSSSAYPASYPWDSVHAYYLSFASDEVGVHGNARRRGNSVGGFE